MTKDYHTILIELQHANKNLNNIKEIKVDLNLQKLDEQMNYAVEQMSIDISQKMSVIINSKISYIPIEKLNKLAQIIDINLVKYDKISNDFRETTASLLSEKELLDVSIIEFNKVQKKSIYHRFGFGFFSGLIIGVILTIGVGFAMFKDTILDNIIKNQITITQQYNQKNNNNKETKKEEKNFEEDFQEESNY